ncbi:MAG: hypothetical protein ACRD9R_08130 [Pyrinomonadaceae bacterium]
MNKEKWISADALAERLHISRSSVDHGKCHTHRLTKYRFGRRVVFLAVEVEALEKWLIDRTKRKQKYLDDAGEGN